MSFSRVATIFCVLSLSTTATANQEKRYIVKLKAGQEAAFDEAVTSLGGKRLKRIKRRRALSAYLSKQAMEALRSNPSVEYIEEDVKRYPAAEIQPYGIDLVQANLLPQGDINAGGVTVCIIDSGYDLSHPDLPKDATGSDDVASAGVWYQDGSGHGTHVAGTIAAVANDEGVVGVLPGETINLHIVRVFDDSGTWAWASDLVAAIEDCQDAGASIVNMSLGGPLATNTEREALQNLYDEGVLLIAAAGNNGTDAYSYPASYDSVVSVGGIDEAKAVYTGSQQNDQVELTAPGVNVLSTEPVGAGLTATTIISEDAIESIAMSGSPNGSVTGNIVDCGLGETTCEGAAGNICVLSRGNISFADKVLACESGGGIGAIIYNNESGIVNGTLGDVITSIPSVGVRPEDGAALLERANEVVSLSVELGDYGYKTGTSMATPHVAGVAALVWSYYTECSNEQIRNALTATAQDLGTTGRDNTFGYGLVQALDAYEFLSSGCGNNN